MWTARDARRSREYTCKLLELVDEGMIDKATLIQDLLGWMSEAEVEQFARKNIPLSLLGEEEEDDE